MGFLASQPLSAFIMQLVNRRKCWRLSVLALPIAVATGLAAAGPALAHTRLIGTDPGAGEQVAVAPAVISLAFNEDVLKLGAAVQVVGPNGIAATGPTKLDGRKVSWTLPADLPNGRYTVKWRVADSDGHPLNDTFGFVLAAGAAGPTPAVTSHSPDPSMTGPMDGMEGMPGMSGAQPGQTDGPTLPTGVAIGGLVLLMVMVAGAIVIERRRRPPPSAADRSGPSTG